MLLVLPKSRRLITATEGSGDNLSQEDIKDGFVDYFMTSIYRQEGDELVLEDAGQLLSSALVKDLTLDQTIERLRDYWEVLDEPCELIDDNFNC